MRNVLFLIAFVTFGCFGAVTTDTLKAKGTRLMVKDSTYFMAGIGMLRLSTPLAKIDSLYEWLKIGDSLYIGRPGTSAAKKSLTFRHGGFAEPGAYLTASNGDKIIFYRSAADSYEGVMGVGSQANLWFKSLTPTSGLGGKIEFYVDSACAVPKMRIKRDSVLIYEPLKVDGSITATIINTGNGDCEVHPMNQAVRTTDDPTFDSNTVTDLKVLDDATIDGSLVVSNGVYGNVTGNVNGNVTGNVSGSSGSCTGNAATATTATNQSGGTVDATTGAFSTGITIAGGSQLTAYKTATFQCSLFDNTTFRAVVTARYTIIGNVVILRVPSMNGTLSGGSVSIRTIPEEIRPSNTQYCISILFENSSNTAGICIAFNSEYYALTKSTNASLDAGTGGTGNSGGIAISYILD